jgi:hypothetical protein
MKHAESLFFRISSKANDLIQTGSDQLKIDRSKPLRDVVLKSLQDEPSPNNREASSKKPLRTIVPKKARG